MHWGDMEDKSANDVEVKTFPYVETLYIQNLIQIANKMINQVDDFVVVLINECINGYEYA